MRGKVSIQNCPPDSSIIFLSACLVQMDRTEADHGEEGQSRIAAGVNVPVKKTADAPVNARTIGNTPTLMVEIGPRDVACISEVPEYGRCRM